MQRQQLIEQSAMTSVWKEPKISEIKAPSHLIPKIRAAIYYNSPGRMVGADRSIITQYAVAVLVSVFMVVSILIILLPIPFNSGSVILASLFGSGISLILFYRWGWHNYEEAWYHVDKENNLLSVIKKTKGSWEEIEIPFEMVSKVEWSGGKNGYATIHAGGIEVRTTRASTDRFASVTEMWSLLAEFDTLMSGWPLTLECSTCNRKFGHHLGTAQCPFDEVILTDTNAKGRIDPEEMHPDDYTRV